MVVRYHGDAMALFGTGTPGHNHIESITFRKRMWLGQGGYESPS